MEMTKNIIQLKNGFINLPNGKQSNYVTALSVVSELMQFGYILDEKAISNLSCASIDDIVIFHNEVIEYLKEMTGSNRSYKPFWKGFPVDVMSKTESELWNHQIMHYLSNGHYEPSEFISNRPTAFEQPSYTKITAGNNDMFLSIFTKLVSVNQSLTADDISIVKFYINNNIELKMPNQIPFKENLVLLASFGLDVPVKTVTDVLRICVKLSGGDISLPKVPNKLTKQNPWSRVKSENKERLKFRFKKFNRTERKYILGLLEKTNCDVTEFVLKEERWVRLGEILHPGEYHKKFPKSFKMFNDIRNTNVKSWYGEVDSAFKINFKAGIEKLSERPGEFMRRIDSLVRNNSNENVNSVLNTLQKVSKNVSNKVLFESFSHFEKRNVPTIDRTIMIKGARKKTKLPELPAINNDIIEKIQAIITSTLLFKFSTLEKMGKVFIHEDLKKLPLPTNMRSMSSTLKPVMRGQRVAIGNKNSKIIRAFVHWFDEYGNQDIDLTSTFVGMGKFSHIGWNGNHNNSLGCYSGDVRHRQGACAEYIDININEAVKMGYKYAIIDAKNYNGGSFSNITDCVFGYMEREYQTEDKMFIPKTLANTVRLQNESSSTVVAAIDLETCEYIFLDVDTTGIPVTSNDFNKILDAIKPYTESPKFSVYDLIKLHVDSRGEFVETPEDADISITLHDFPSYVDIGKWMGV
jgi:hypothetical protein